MPTQVLLKCDMYIGNTFELLDLSLYQILIERKKKNMIHIYILDI